MDSECHKMMAETRSLPQSKPLAQASLLLFLICFCMEWLSRTDALTSTEVVSMLGAQGGACTCRLITTMRPFCLQSWALCHDLLQALGLDSSWSEKPVRKLTVRYSVATQLVLHIHRSATGGPACCALKTKLKKKLPALALCQGWYPQKTSRQETESQSQEMTPNGQPNLAMTHWL